MANKKVQKAGKAAQSARSNPYVQRLIEDEDLRQNIVQAYESARDAYGRLSNGKSPTKQIFDDKKLQKHVKEAAGNVRDVSVGAATRRRRSRRQRRRPRSRSLLLGIVGGAVALALSEGLRKKVLDALFGAEEEFEYTSTTSTPTRRRARPPRLHRGRPPGALFVCEGADRAPISLQGRMLDVYGLCLGGNVFGWTADRDASFAVLDAYVEAGGNFIDTADTYMRPNMGISETIIGEWMAARGNRDALVIATKVGSDGGLSAREHRDARRRVAGAAADRPDRPLLRPQGRRVGAGRGDRARVRRAGARRQGAPRRRLQLAGRAAARVAGARRARGPGRLRRGCSRTTTSSSARGYEREYAPIVAAHGLAVAPYYALATGFLTGKYRPRRRDGGLARAPAGASRTSTRAARRCWPRWTRSPPRTTSPVAAVALAWLLGQARASSRRSPAPARSSSSRRVLPARRARR